MNARDVPCSIPWSFMLISQHVKKVVACPYHTRPYGDLERNTLEEIWNGPEAQGMRTSLLHGKIPDFCLNHSVACPVITRYRAEGRFGDPSDFIEVGKNDFGAFGTGWYSLENLPEAVRWTMGRAEFRIVTRDKTRIHVQALALNPEADADPLTGALLLGGTEAGRFTVDRVGTVRLTFAIPPAARADAAEGAIVVDNPWSPAEVMGTADSRRLGLAVKRIWVT